MASLRVAGAHEQPDADGDQWQGIDHAQRKRSGDVACKRIWLADELDENARRSIDHCEDAAGATGVFQRAVMVGCNPDGDKEEQALKDSFVYLCGVARHGLAGKYDPPRQAGWCTPEFRIDEIGKAAQAKTHWYCGCAQIQHAVQGFAFSSTVNQTGNDHAQKSAMEGHAPIKRFEDIDRVGEVEVRLVEQDVSEPATEHHASKTPQEEVIGFRYRQSRRIGPPESGRIGHALHIQAGKKQACDIGQRVPMHFEGTQAEGDWIDVGECNGGQHSAHVPQLGCPRNWLLNMLMGGLSYWSTETLMTATSSKFFDELAKLMSNASGAAQGVRKEIDSLVQSQVERILNNLNVVKREEFDVVRDMAEKARSENEALAKRVAELESKFPKTQD